MKHRVNLVILSFVMVFSACENEPLGTMNLNEQVLDEELFELVSQVAETEGENAINCIEFNYTFVIFVFDAQLEFAEVVPIRSDLEFSTFLGNLDDSYSISLNYPISGTLNNGEFIEINTNQELKEAIDACRAEELQGQCNNTQIDCVWKVGALKGAPNDYEGAEKTGSFGISYGATVNLSILERYTLSFGALKTRFSNSTNNSATTTTEERSQILSFTETEFNTFNSFLGNDETLTILQDIEYVEMPFHVKYRLGGIKLGLHVYGGFSTYILANDEVMARNTTGETLSLVRASKFSAINISIDGGFGFYYNFTETLGLKINPTYKYHLNTITAQSFNAKTYSMGIFSGLRYKF